MTDLVEDWIEAVAPGMAAVKAALAVLPPGTPYPWRRHSPATHALCVRIVTSTNRELRAYGCRSADSLPCSEACRACVVLCGETR